MGHGLEIYIWVRISCLGEIEVKRGLDKNFPQAREDLSASIPRDQEIVL